MDARSSSDLANATILNPFPRGRIFDDAYHFLLRSRWWVLFASLFCLYVFANIVFALLYLAGGNGIENARPGHFSDAFFFSVQTMATIGYGHFHPIGTYHNLVATAEALMGLIGFAMASGLMFAKFARPTARVVFSRVATISPRDGVPSLVFRMANGRTSHVAEATVSVVMVKTEKTKEGEQIRRLYDLNLVRARSPVFALTWTVIHPITNTSPFFGETPESIKEKNADFFVSIVGIDALSSSTIHSRHRYRIQDIRWNHQLKDIIKNPNSEIVTIDYKDFHDSSPIK